MADILYKRPMNAEMTIFKAEVNPDKLDACIDDILMRVDRLEAKFAGIQSVNQWINVKDRLPDEDGWYLVCKHNRVRVAEWCKDCWYNESDFPIDDCAITYWQPLPEPPKDGDVE